AGLVWHSGEFFPRSGSTINNHHSTRITQHSTLNNTMATRLDPLEYLERDDKWYLGGGSGAMFAPAFPRWLDRFGFWDEAYFADVRVERLFTILILNEDERPLTL